MKQIAVPRREGGNVVVKLDVEDYKKGVEELKFSIVGRLSLQRGQDPPTNKFLRQKLEEFLGCKQFKLIPLKGGIYHVLFNSLQDQALAMTKGAINIKPGVLRICRWYPGFDPYTFKLTTSQVWIRGFMICLWNIGRIKTFSVLREELGYCCKLIRLP